MSRPTFFGIKNNTSRDICPCEPWNFKPNVPAAVAGNEIKYKQWRASSKTEHLIFTASEAVNPKNRCADHNPVKRLHGLIADYDAGVTHLEREGIAQRCPESLMPMWASTTNSGGARVVWVFEEPLVLDQKHLAKEFMKYAAKQLNASGISLGFDEPAFYDLTKLYDVGTNWVQISDQALRANTIQHWLFEASKKVSWSKLSDIMIPIDTIADEVERKFPGVWPDQFELGARGPVFWDGGDNPTSCIVAEAGMICFSRDKTFYPWAEIFGGSFVRQYQEDKIGQATRDVWYDGNLYYRKIDGVWMGVAKDDFSKWLSTARRLNRIAPNEQTPSEVWQAEVFVHETRRVAGVAPRIYDSRDVIEIDGKKFLNNSYVRPVQPVVEAQEWGENFPFIASLIEARISEIERPYFFGWHQRFYSSALQGDPEKGHTLFLVGTVNLGKTLFSHHVIGGLMGGFADASSYVTKGSEFNKELFEKGLWVIDDGEVATDAAAHRKFSEIVKKIVANPMMGYRAMFRDNQTTKWNGRLVITLNDDEHSVRMIPDLEVSMEEKVMILKFEDRPFQFLDRAVQEAKIEAERPFYGRWLLDYVVPKEIIGSKRLGIKGYINEELRIKALKASDVADIIELTEIWIRRARPIEKHPDKYWQGSPTEWYAELSSDETLRPLISKFTVRQLARKFTDASRIPGSRISIVKSKGHGSHQYRIYLNGDPERANKEVSTSFKPDDPASNAV